MSRARIIEFVAAFAVLVTGMGTFSEATAAGSVSCPEGFVPIPSGRACMAANFAGTDGSFSKYAKPVSPSNPSGCPEGWTKPVGVNFCVANNLTINAIGDLAIFELQTSRFCPEGFHRHTGSTICVASNLMLKKEATGLVLNGSTTQCPIGFFRQTGSTICAAGNATTVSSLPQPSGPRCPKGTARPPGVSVCVALDIVYASPTPAEAQAPVGSCPANWVRPIGSRFCIPGYEKANTMVNPTFGFTPNLCPIGTYESWFDMPIYDAATGFWVIGYVPTRFCIPNDLEPAM